MKGSKYGIYGLSRVLAVLIVSRDDYSVVDNVTHASSKAVALHYISEHLRDYASVEKKLEDAYLKRYASSIDFASVESELDEIRSADYRAFQMIKSLIVSQAISEASRIRQGMRRSKALSVLKCLESMGFKVAGLDPKTIIDEIKARREKIIAGCGIREEDLSEIDEKGIYRALMVMKKREEAGEEEGE